MKERKKKRRRDKRRVKHTPIRVVIVNRLTETKNMHDRKQSIAIPGTRLKNRQNKSNRPEETDLIDRQRQQRE